MENISIVNLQKKIPLSLKKIRKISKFVLSAEGCKRKSISIIIAGDRKLRALNKRFLKKGRATDVLAFSFDEGRFSKINPASLLGDIFVSVDKAIANAKIYNTTPLQELYLYVIHGILHLLGYEDSTPGKRTAMQKKEQHYLQRVKG